MVYHALVDMFLVMHSRHFVLLQLIARCKGFERDALQLLAHNIVDVETRIVMMSNLVYEYIFACYTSLRGILYIHIVYDSAICIINIRT